MFLSGSALALEILICNFLIHSQILFACLLGWAVSAILTVAGALSDDPKSDQFYARTDSRLYVVEQTKWFVLPYPGKYTPPPYIL